MHALHKHIQMYGANELSTLDLLALTLTQKADPPFLLCLTRLLQEYPVRRLRQVGVSELQQAGLTRIQASRLVALCELTRRLALPKIDSLPQIKTPGDAAALLLPLMEHLEQETLRMLILDTKNQVRENREIYRGTIDRIEVRLAEILRPAIVCQAPALLIAHGHPSGNPEPSELTWRKKFVKPSA